MRLIAAREGRLCLRLFRRSDGTVVTADCWARLRAARQRGFLGFAAMLVVVAWVELAAVLFGLWNLRRTVVGGQMGAPVSTVVAPPVVPVPVPVKPFHTMGVRLPRERGTGLLGEMGDPDPGVLDKVPRPKKPKASPRLMGTMKVR